MIHFAACADSNDIAFPRNAREAGGEAMVVLLRPAIRGMGVASGTGDLRAQKDAPHMLGQVARVSGESEEVSRRVSGEAAGGRQQFSSKLIEGCVAGHLPAEPFLIGPRRLLTASLSTDQQQIRQPQGPQVDELVSLQQFIDEAL